MKITYKAFKEYCLNEGYTLKDTHHLYHVIQKMDKESQLWINYWFNTGKVPKIEIENIDIHYLINQYEMKPINAFIIMDWLKTNPIEAKYYLTQIPSAMIVEDEVVEHMKNIVGEAEIPQINLNDIDS